MFILVDKDIDLGGPIWLGRIVPNTFYDQFQKKTLWVADKRVDLDGIRLDAGYIYLTNSML